TGPIWQGAGDLADVHPWAVVAVRDHRRDGLGQKRGGCAPQAGLDGAQPLGGLIVMPAIPVADGRGGGRSDEPHGEDCLDNATGAGRPRLVLGIPSVRGGCPWGIISCWRVTGELTLV